MKKVFLTVLVLIVMLSVDVFAQQAEITLTNGIANRTGDIGPHLKFDFNLKNNFLVDTIKFKISVTALHSRLKAKMIPARPVLSDGFSLDSNKWTMDTSRISDTVSNFLIVANQPVNYWARSEVSRKIMENFVALEALPNYDTITVTLSDIVINGVNDNSGNVTVTLPPATIVFYLGNEPPDVKTDSVLVRLTSQIERQNNLAKLFLDFKTKFNVSKLIFTLIVPTDLTDPVISLAQPQAGRQAVVEKAGTIDNRDYYVVTLMAATDAAYGPSLDQYSALAEIDLRLPSSGSGLRQVQAMNFLAWGLADESLKTGPDWLFNLDLGQPPTPKDFAYAVDFSVDRQKQEAYLDFSYISNFGFDEVTFDFILPDKVYLKVPTAIEFFGSTGSYELIDVGNNTFAVKISLTNPLGPSLNATKFMRITLGFAPEVVGRQELIFGGVRVKRDGVELKVDGPISLMVDFRQNDPALLVKYFLTKAANWITPVTQLRRAGQGTMEWLWFMNNIVETTGGITFDVQLPYYMTLKQVIPLTTDFQTDNNVNITIQKVGEVSSLSTYHVVYSVVDIGQPLLPNPQSLNPRAIMKLVIEFTDLPPWGMDFWVRNIIASGLDGRVLNQTKAMFISINFLTEVYWQFLKGDVSQQFGDGQLTKLDVEVLIKILSGEIRPTLYQIWAADLNNDGFINIYDLTILQNLVGISAVTDLTANGQWQLKDKVLEYRLDADWVQLSIYDCLGNLIDNKWSTGSTGQFNLEQLPVGVYLFKLNGLTGKILISN